MKLIVTMMMLASSTVSLALNLDGCYVTYVEGAMYPAICISGSNEEAAVPTTRIAVFETNTDVVGWCAQVDTQERLSFEEDVVDVKFGFDPNTGMKSIALKGKEASGDITFDEVAGSIELKYSRLNKETSERLFKKMYESEKCANL